uniref:Rhythmically expressed protein 5 n=1 Tax=Triatoma infestans TaxID=30076 RepID=A0A170VAC6_TRIIF
MGTQLVSQEEASTNIEKYTSSPSRYMVGPMVVRVLPDGSPVPRDSPLPKDEDAEEFLAMRSKTCTFDFGNNIIFFKQT